MENVEVAFGPTLLAVVASVCIYLFHIARAKSEAVFNIYSLLKQNTKSCNAKEMV